MVHVEKKNKPDVLNIVDKIIVYIHYNHYNAVDSWRCLFHANCRCSEMFREFSLLQFQQQSCSDFWAQHSVIYKLCQQNHSKYYVHIYVSANTPRTFGIICFATMLANATKNGSMQSVETYFLLIISISYKHSKKLLNRQKNYKK